MRISSFLCPLLFLLSSLSFSQASETSARVALQRAQQNLAYTSIYAPIDGVVVERNVNTGQTVAASLSAPQLFLIANDLAHMQILAQVGESDIDRIKQGQPVKFTVQALPGRTFTGAVQQVRLQSKTTENVVASLNSAGPSRSASLLTRERSMTPIVSGNLIGS